MSLNLRQKMFCLEYINNGFNGTKAYLKIYKCRKEVAAQNASESLRKPYIQEEIARLLNEKAGITKERVLNEISEIAFSDITEYFDFKNVERQIGEKTIKSRQIFVKNLNSIKINTKAIQSVKETRDGFQITLFDKLRALEKLGENLGIFKNNTMENNDDFEILKEIADHLARLDSGTSQVSE